MYFCPSCEKILTLDNTGDLVALDEAGEACPHETCSTAKLAFVRRHAPVAEEAKEGGEGAAAAAAGGVQDDEGGGEAAQALSPHGHRVYTGGHTPRRTVQRRGCDDDACARRDTNELWKCDYCNYVWHADCACEFDDGEAKTKPRLWECPSCEGAPPSGDEAGSSDDDDDADQPD